MPATPNRNRARACTSDACPKIAARADKLFAEVGQPVRGEGESIRPPLTFDEVLGRCDRVGILGEPGGPPGVEHLAADVVGGAEGAGDVEIQLRGKQRVAGSERGVLLAGEELGLEH